MVKEIKNVDRADFKFDIDFWFKNKNVGGIIDL